MYSYLKIINTNSNLIFFDSTNLQFDYLIQAWRREADVRACKYLKLVFRHHLYLYLNTYLFLLVF